MDLKGAEIRNVKNLCSEMGNNKAIIPMRVNIPYYQRPYKWGEENIGNLISDFNKNSQNEYFVGSAVMVVYPDKRHDVIDGQQRITTMFLLSYLKFLLQRAYIEELLNKRKMYLIDTALTKLEELSAILFGDGIRDRVKNAHTNILKQISQDNPDDNMYDAFLQEFQAACYLPEKNLTDIVAYEKDYCLQQQLLLKNADLSLKYSRESYNKKLEEALSKYMILLSDANNPYDRIPKTDDELVAQYINALHFEFNDLSQYMPVDGKMPLDYATSLIDAIDLMLENIKFCVIITGKEKDAYTLFEVLNDRALEIEDLDLIKNLFYKWYCHHAAGETDDDIDACIEEVDKIWVENVFPSDTGKERSKLISFFATEFFTADDSLKFNDNERYREILETKYLNSIQNYSSKNIKNDILVYQMCSMLIKGFGLVFQAKGAKVLEAETDSSKSITYKAFHLLNALKQYGVMPALSNIIIKKFIDNNILDDGIVDIQKFDAYIQGIVNDYKNDNVLFKDIHEIAFELWKFALLSSGADLPRQEAKRIITANNVLGYDTNYSVSKNDFDKMQSQFEDWMFAWKYGKSDPDLKAKVLFINLFSTEKKNDKLELLATARSFRTTEIQLDHMEASNVNPGAEEKYFKPEKTGEQRTNYTDSIGNFMILDSDNNNNKNNLPLEQALPFYDKMCANHWMIDEVKAMLSEDEYSKEVPVAASVCRVPNDAFFVQRTNRLIAYFKTILSRNMGDKSMQILSVNKK